MGRMRKEISNIKISKNKNRKKNPRLCSGGKVL